MPSVQVRAKAQVDREAVEAFLFLEARLQDEHRYDEWEALWTDDALYWVPIGDDSDPTESISYIFDNRARLASRIRQLKTGRRHAQAPASRLRRLISNVEFTQKGDTVNVASNFLLVEVRRGAQILWVGRTEHELIVLTDGFKIKKKKVLLGNNLDAITNLAFLI